MEINKAKLNIEKKGFLYLEIDPTLDLIAAINQLKREKNAIIVAHY